MVDYKLLSEWYSSASVEGKKIIDRYCNVGMIEKRYKPYFEWEQLSDRHKSDIPKVIELYYIICDLYNNHYDDLVLYSKMYRDVSFRFDRDFLSIIYFGLRKDEIIGYKKHLEDLSASSFKAQVALLYINNEKDFKEFCKRLGIEKLGEILFDDTSDSFLREHYLNHLYADCSKRDGYISIGPIEDYEYIIDNGIYTHNYFSVCNLTDEQCEIILNEKAMLTNIFNQEESKEKVYNDYLARYTYIGQSRGVERTCFLEKHAKDNGIFFNEKKGLEVSERDLFLRCLFPTRMDSEYRSEQDKNRKQEEEEKEKNRIEEERKRKEKEEQRLLKYGFNKRNKHTRDERLSFNDSTHIYTVNGRIFDSVTTIVENAFPKFDSEKHAKVVAEREGLTISQVLKAWEEKGKISREAGTKMHQQIERFLTGLSYERTTEVSLFEYFYNQVSLHPYRTEWAIFDEDSRIAGTVDYVDDENGYILYDWKRSTSILKNGFPDKSNAFGEKGNYPIEHLDNCAYYHYALQLSFYRYILEKNYGITITKQRLGVFHSSYNKPYILEMPYLKQEVESIIGLRSEIIL